MPIGIASAHFTGRGKCLANHYKPLLDLSPSSYEMCECWHCIITRSTGKSQLKRGAIDEAPSNKESLFCFTRPLEHIDFNIISYWTSNIWSLWHISPHRLLFSISSKRSFICTFQQTGQHIPQPLMGQLWTTGSHQINMLRACIGYGHYCIRTRWQSRPWSWAKS